MALTRWGSLILLCLTHLSSLPARAAEAEMGTLQIKAGVAGVALFLDGERIGESPFNAPWALTPGPHTLEARPEGAAVESRAFEIKAGQVTVVSVLAAPPVKAATHAEPKIKVVHTGPGFSLAMTSYGLMGLGGVAAGLGVLYGISANDKAATARGLDKALYARADQLALVEDADGYAFYSNLSFGAAGALLLGGAALLYFASDSPLSAGEPAPGFTWGLGADGQSLRVGGQF
ncbi:hypothetical protein KKF91_21610 [Myxococcota bacterium]|nr:hypothetical protein [Myxococcota bacterium]MBU1433143.1 hypothetical protein [Myxococcota bacterium]MBU1896340.1 hypothetical protein [Myxococcota bacterium]